MVRANIAVCCSGKLWKEASGFWERLVNEPAPQLCHFEDSVDETNGDETGIGGRSRLNGRFALLRRGP